MLGRRFVQLLVIIFGVFVFQCVEAAPPPPPPPTPSVPHAAFLISPDSPTVNQAVLFSDTTTGKPTSWSWTFGDGTTSALQNPSHAYQTGGTFTVTLKASNAGGSGIVSKALTAKVAPPVAAFNFSPSAPASGQAVLFKDTSTGKPTSWSWTFGDGTTSALQNPSHAYSAAGTFTVTLKASNAGGFSTSSHPVTVGRPQFNLSQTLSDEAQRTTLAFAGLGMITGNLDAQSFFPPGKVSDYFGFQYLRDNDPDNMGHNTDFLTRIANNVIYILTDSQFNQMKTLATTQVDQYNLYGYERFSLMEAFRRELNGTLPAGSPGLNLDSVKKASEGLYLLDGQMSFDRALLYATVLNSMNATQKAYLDAMKGKGFNSWPNITNAQIQAKMQTLPQGSAVAVMTYASDMFSWYAGSVDADVYFCPERHGTYYGSFYMKDAPGMGQQGYSMNEQLTATAGAALSDSSKGYVSSSQALLMSSLVDTQRNNLYASPTSNIVTVRTEISTLLRSLLQSTATSAAVKAQVLALSQTYGDLDGENNYHYATVFTQVYNTLSSDQKTSLAALRKSILSGTYANGTPFDYTVCTTPFLYSDPITNPSVLAPYISNTDYLFFEP